MMEEKKINKALDYCLLVNQDDLEGDCTQGKKKLKTEAQLLENKFLCRIWAEVSLSLNSIRSEMKSVNA